MRNCFRKLEAQHTVGTWNMEHGTWNIQYNYNGFWLSISYFGRRLCVRVTL
ncbi:Uncharacterized protein TCM_000022 [Theobroma cacao]|uniref:Uncharacterized protein n=1 Tax=Theobroma cacao TaxID=3641 RepID=A0A061DF01_THECC|nr:Uncharacterized protein TCM_000022 [Theobroma cacao]